MGANAFWNSFGSASAMTLTLAILPDRLAPPVLTVTLAHLEAIEARERKPRYNEPMLADDFDHWLAGRTTEPGLTKTLPTTPSIIDRSLASSWSAANSFRAQSASCEADDMVAICPSRARPSPRNDVSRTNGRWRMVGSTQSVVIGSWLGGWSGLVSRF